MRKLLFLILGMILSVAIIGCGQEEQEQQEQTANAPQVAVSTKPEENSEQQENKTNASIAFPESYSDSVENVEFNMDIVIDADLTKEQSVTAKARLQKVDSDEAFKQLYSDIGEYEIYEYEENDEYGKLIDTRTYVSPEETTLSYGPLSSRVSYMQRDLMPYIRSAFILDKEDAKYNAKLFSTSDQLSFMTREDAFQTIDQTLKAMGVTIDHEYTGYALDYSNLQSQEYHEDMDGNNDGKGYKASWTSEDDCYYFCMNQKYKGLPMHHVYYDLFANIMDANSPIQAVVSKNGIEFLEVEKVFEISDDDPNIQLASIESVAETAANKYNQMQGTSSYELTKAELYYYVDLSSGNGIYDVKPAWIITGMEKTNQGESDIQVMIDAQTAEEIVL